MTDPRRFLLVVGLPKSGTTFIYSQLSAMAAHFNLPVAGKEIDYFRSGRDLDAYMSRFATHDDKVYLDASPLYMDDVVASAERISQCLSEHDVRILICVRDVYERIYSHYLHDIAQNFQIFGHGQYSFNSPPVMAKYLYPISERIQHLQAVFGAGNVYGFSFAAPNIEFKDMLRDFARLPSSWDFDFSDNPAPGFTSPRVYYDAQRDTAVTIGGESYLLPARWLLIVNRQFSVLNPSVSPEVGRRLFESQASIQRTFDPRVFSSAARDRIEADQRRGTKLLDLDLDVNHSSGALCSRESDDLPAGIRGRLQRLDSLDDLVARAYDSPLSSSTHNIFACPEPGSSIAKSVANIAIAALEEGRGRKSVADELELIIAEFGPIPVFLSKLVKHKLRLGLIDDIEALIAPYGTVANLMVPIEIASYVRDKKIALSEGDIRRLAALGLRTGN
jgi:hypothetical protein